MLNLISLSSLYSKKYGKELNTFFRQLMEMYSQQITILDEDNSYLPILTTKVITGETRCLTVLHEFSQNGDLQAQKAT
jgi:hypothetical protein